MCSIPAYRSYRVHAQHLLLPGDMMKRYYSNVTQVVEHIVTEHIVIRHYQH